MASLQTTADLIRDSMGSASSCTPMTATILGDLLLPKPSSKSTNVPTNLNKKVKPAAVSRQKTVNPTPARSRGKKAATKDQDGVLDHVEQLSPKERSILAFEVINAALKTLSQGVKAPPPPVRQPVSSRDLMKASERKTLRRSRSLPHSPLKPRSLSRVSSSPSVSTGKSRSTSSASLISSRYRSTAECTRVAFACLRELQASNISGIYLSPLQLENGMSALIGKLVSLGLDDLAVKELRILKRLLDDENHQSALKKSDHISQGNTSNTTPQTLAGLLEFGRGAIIGPKLWLVITTQLQILRLMSSSRKPIITESALPLLRPSHSSSPTRLLLLAAKDSKQTDKVARQLQTLSEILLSLAPSISTADDAIALESRISVTPEVAIQLQTLALHNRVLWWKLATHKGDPAKEVLSPFLRCLSALARRSHGNALETYRISSSAFLGLQAVLSECPDSNAAPPSILAGIYRLLGSLSQEANLIGEAIDWIEKSKALIDTMIDSDARRYAIIARLVSLSLRVLPKQSKAEELLLTLLEGLEMPFKGEMSEIEDLLTEVSLARKAAITGIAARNRTESTTISDQPMDGVNQMCESLVFLCPRLSLRYLGRPPDVNSTPKDIIRHEQQRKFISRSSLNSIDSALFLIKILLGEERLTWNLMDSVLQDCLSLLDRLYANSRENILDDSGSSSSSSSSSSSYYVRISNLYFTQYLNFRRDTESPKDGQQLRAVRRSIDCIRARTQHEKIAGFLTTKLERMADIFKITGRYDELSQTLFSLRDEMIDNGVLSGIAALAATEPIRVAWSQDEDTSVLSRTVNSLVKIQLKYSSPSPKNLLPGDSWSVEESGAMLEHQLEILSTQSRTSHAVIDLQTKVFQALLSVYDRHQYPIRRLRVLTRLLSLDLGRHQRVLDGMPEMLYPSQVEEIRAEGTRDEGLRDYVTHLKSLAATVAEFHKDQPKIDVLNQSLAKWSSIRRQCEDLKSLERQVDDVPGLLDHLQFVADYLQMRGHDIICVAVLRLIAEFNELRDDSSNPDDTVLAFTRLGTQWLQLGYSGKAGLAFDKAQSYSHRNGVTTVMLLQLHISCAEYLLAIGNYDKCEENLNRAKALFYQEKEFIQVKTLQKRTRMNQLISHSYLVCSMLALERGALQIALTHAKQSVRLIRRAWMNAEEEEPMKFNETDSSPLTVTEASAEEISHLSMSTLTAPALNAPRPIPSGSAFWKIIKPLFRALSHLSELYAHHGMFQETIYYMEQAHRLVKEVGSEAHLAVASSSLGSTWLKAGSLDKGSEYLMKAKELFVSGDKSRDTAILAYHIGNMHGLLSDRDAELAAYEDAEAILNALAGADHISTIDRITDPFDALEAKTSQLTISRRNAVGSRKTTTRSKPIAKQRAVIIAKAPIDASSSIDEECPQLTSLKATVLRHKSRVLMLMKRNVEALGLLHESENCLGTQMDAVNQGLAMAKQLLFQAIEQMMADPVYSVLQDSTISFPSVVGLSKVDKNSVDRMSVSRPSPPRRLQTTKSSRDRANSKSPVPDSFIDKLCQAQEHLREVHSVAMFVAPVALLHTMSNLLNNVAILLSAAGHVKGKVAAHPGFASSSIETTRTLAFRRERRIVQADQNAKLEMDDLCWPNLTTSDPRRSSLGAFYDMSRFQRDYIDVIPKSWTAISISLSDSRQELSITKLQAGHSPFILRLPLRRNNSIDADEEVFGFEEGHTELLEIIDLANESAHDARDMTGREAKTAWWEERETLDARLRDLLENIEKVWLGGFTGIFSQHDRRPDLLARFQKSFQNILDKHLPSRRRTGKRATGPRITLDTRLLDLFIGLGDASREDCDFSEPLTDLLYFVVDVLQFHGELNAYAEIDFDSIVLETQDALSCYHQAIRASNHKAEGQHTILILDKTLHSFPWESLPCMDGLAVSRLPSLGCLRDRIIHQQENAPADCLDGYYIGQDNGTYILNPGGDLKFTQATFQKSLEALSDWDGIVKREPLESEFKASLESKDLFLYFGHGSGAQYIRAREIRKLDKCAVTMLMGCSSGALTEAGEFEPYGPPINYMHAGCPALVATLWDVTDKDIDRFAKSTFEHWGLFRGVETQPEVLGGGRGRKKGGTAKLVERKQSLVEAVAKGRDACNLRYLNAAAVCVYGVPVYFR